MISIISLHKTNYEYTTFSVPLQITFAARYRPHNWMAAASSEETAGELRALLHQFAHRDESDEDVKCAPLERSSPSPTSAQVAQAAPSALTSTSNQTLESEPASASAAADAASTSQPLPSSDELPLAVAEQAQHAGTKRAAANAASTIVESASEEIASAPSNCKVARVEEVGGGGGIGAVGEEHLRERDRAADDASPSKAISPTHQPQTSTVHIPT